MGQAPATTQPSSNDSASQERKPADQQLLSISPRPAAPAAPQTPEADPLQAQLKALESQAALLGLHRSSPCTPTTPAASPAPKADPLQAQLLALESQAALLDLHCSPACAPHTPQPAARPRAICSASSAADSAVDEHLETVLQLLHKQAALLTQSSQPHSQASAASTHSCRCVSDYSIHSRSSHGHDASQFSISPPKAPQQPWHLPSATRVDAAELQHPASGPQILGQGGMGCVSLMEDTLLDQLVAVKVPFMRGDSDHQDRIMMAVQREHTINDLLSVHSSAHMVEYLGPLEKDGELTGSLAFQMMPGGCLSSNMCALLHRCRMRYLVPACYHLEHLSLASGCACASMHLMFHDLALTVVYTAGKPWPPLRRL